MSRPRRQTYTMKQYLDNVKEGYISNDVAIQRNPAWKPIVDGLVVTILTDDYIPPIILAEEENGRTVIVDGGSRTAAFKMICNGNYKIKPSVEDPIIKYKKMDKDENGKTIWSDAEFDIRNKTFEQFPKELQKKFYEYQVDTVIHECDSEKIAKYFRRYNIHTSMNANEKMFIYLPKFADKVKNITSKQFFINHSAFTDNEKEKGLLERVVSESIMCMFHLDKWNKVGKKISTFLNDNASDLEFDRLYDNIERLENIISDDIKDVFNSKNSFIWFTLFNRFVDLGIEDIKFAEFLREFKNGFRNKPVDGKLFDTVDATGSTKDKSVINDKLHILETLMKEFLHNKQNTQNTNTESFIAENLDMDIKTVHENMDFYEGCLSELTYNTIKDGSKLLNKENHISLLAMFVYSFENNVDLKDWLTEYAKNNNTYFIDQKKNYFHMRQDLERYCKNNEKENRKSA